MALRPNNSFKPNLLRYTKAMAEKACHGFGSTTQVGLTQALGLMNTVEEHSHNFLPGAWPFADAVHTAAFTSAQVLAGAPVLLVFHDHDGEWQFLHGPVTEQDDCRLICLGCAYDRDNAVGILADLQPGWMASRASTSSAWECEPYDSDDDGHEA